jgi:hypothetical protein
MAAARRIAAAAEAWSSWNRWQSEMRCDERLFHPVRGVEVTRKLGAAVEQTESCNGCPLDIGPRECPATLVQRPGTGVIIQP